MADEKIILPIEIDASGGIASIGKLDSSFAPLTGTIGALENELAGFKSSLISATDPAQISALNRQIVDTKNKIQQITAESKSFAVSSFGVSRATRIAHGDLEQISRSIVNFSQGNERGVDTLSNLVFTFERLKGATGSTKVALGALVSTFLGPAGLLIGISTVVTVIGPLITKLFDAKKEISETEQKIKDLIQPLDELKKTAASNADAEIIKVQTLATVISNQTKSYSERNNALKQLQDINKNYFGDLTLESDKLATLKGRVEEYTNALIASSIVKAFGDEIGKIGKELALHELALTKATTSLGLYTKGIDAAGAPIIKIADIQGEFIKSIDELNTKILKETPLVKILKDQYTDLRGALQKAVEETLKFKSLTTIETKKIEIVTITLGKVSAILPEIIIPSTSIKVLSPEFNLVGVSEKLQKALHKELSPEQFANGVNKKFEQISKSTDFSQILKIHVELAEDEKEKNKKLGSLEGITKETALAANSINETLTPAFQNLFQAILKGENPLKAFFNTIIAGIEQLISKLIAAAVEALILSVILPGGGGGFGKLFEKLIGLGGTANIGFAGSGGGAILGGRVEFEIQGSRLIGVLNNAQAQNTRHF